MLHLRTLVRHQPAGHASQTCCCLPVRHSRWLCIHTTRLPWPVLPPLPRSRSPRTLRPVEHEVNALKAQCQWTARSSCNIPPPEYHGPNDTHLAENTATFAARKATQACFVCDVHGQLIPSMSCPGQCRLSCLRWLAPPRFLCGLARILLSSRACLASLQPRRVPGVSPSCSTLARRTASCAVILRLPGCDALPPAVDSPGPRLRDDGRPWGHARPACADAGAPRPG